MTPLLVHDARGPDADAQNGSVRVGDESAGERDDGLDHVLRASRNRNARAGDDVSVESQHGADERVAARQIEADDPVPVPVEIDEHGGLPGAGCLADAPLDDEAVGDQVGDEVRDRDPGEAGLAGEIRPRHRTLVEERLEHERAVVTASVLGKHLAALAESPSRAERAGARGSGMRVRRLEGGRAALHFRCRHVC